MKHVTLPLVLLVSLCLLAAAAYSTTTTHTYFFTQPRVEMTNGVTAVIMDGATTWGRVGHPLLPYAPVQLLLPPGEEAVSITVAAPDPVVLGDGYRISHRLQPYPLSLGAPAETTPPDAAIYGSDDPHPVELGADLQTQFLAGHGIAYAVAFPVTYRPVSGELVYYPWLQVTIESQPTARAQEANLNMLKRHRALNERLAGMVQNQESILLYGPEEPQRPNGYNQLAIVPSAYLPYYQDFLNYKNRSGVLTHIITMEEIRTNYTGIDDQDKVRNCIIDYYTNYDITYVFICSDDDLVPDRPLYCNAGYTDHLPGDLYYSGLDGNWNNDGDTYWGEPGEEDYIGEVYVGRSFADDATEIQHVVNKNMLYQTAPVMDEIETALMVGEDLGWPIWAWEYKEEIRLGSSNWGYTTVGIPHSITVSTLYETPGYTWSAMNDLRPLLNLGPNMMNHLGHADYDYVMKFYNSNVTDVNFTNDGINHNFWMGYSQGCMCGGFDQGYDCILDLFTTIGHAAVAFVGNSRYGWGDLSTTNGPSQHFDRQYFDALYAENITTLAWMNQDSKEDNIWLIPSDNTIRWCYYELNLFGDPTLDVWTDFPGTFYPTYNSVALLGSQTFQVTSLTDGAKVTMSMDNDVIGQGIANSSGVATVTFDQPLSQLGTITLMVTQHNMLPYEGSVQVIPPSGPYVIFSSCVVEDAVTGNNNGQLDFGEAVQL
ncbi:MAG: C25 family cysteine peptidase, partial [bacterium]